MPRQLGPALLLVIASACNGTAEPETPAATVVVSDSLGVIYQGASVSPDGNRLAWARTVDGKSAIFVSNLDGSNARQLSNGVWDQDPVWSPDGTWIAYAAESPGYDVMVVSPEGGEPRQLTTGIERDIPAGWLPDGSAVVATRSGGEGEITILAPIDGSPVRRLTPDLPGAQNAAISPDGRWLASERLGEGGSATIWIQPYPGGEPRQLTTDGFEDPNTWTMWAPDSRRIVYTSRRTGTLDLWVSDVTTGEAIQVTTDVHDDYDARWSPDGQWLAFVSNRGGQFDVWVAPSTGGTARRVTNDLAVEADLAWSPDGSQLLYGWESRDAGLAAFSAGSDASREFLEWPNHTIDFATLSPDGSTVLFQSTRSGNRDLWTIPLAGGEPQPFAPSGAASFLPRYAADGSKVLFLSNRAGTVDIWVAAADGTGARGVTDGPAAEYEAEFSPDGTQIAFVSDRGGPGNDLWIIPAEGGEPRRLTTGNRRPEGLQWSPDGRTIYFVANHPDGGRALTGLRVDDGVATVYAVAPFIVLGSVGSSGSPLPYSTFVGGYATVSVVPSDGGPARLMSSRPDSLFQPWSVLSPDGERLAVAEIDLTSNRDHFDITLIDVTSATSTPLTATRDRSEFPVAFTPDGAEILAVLRAGNASIRSIAVGPLLAEGTP